MLLQQEERLKALGELSKVAGAEPLSEEVQVVISGVG
jgi:hypothetical protein